MPNKPTRPKKNEITFEVFEGRPMTDTEIEIVARLMFIWWRRDFEEEELKKEG